MTAIELIEMCGVVVISMFSEKSNPLYPKNTFIHFTIILTKIDLIIAKTLLYPPFFVRQLKWVSATVETLISWLTTKQLGVTRQS